MGIKKINRKSKQLKKLDAMEINFHDMTESQQKFIGTCYNSLYGAPYEETIRIFNLGNPKLIWYSSKKSNKTYFEIHEDSLGLMVVLFKQYLKE